MLEQLAWAMLIGISGMIAWTAGRLLWDDVWYERATTVDKALIWSVLAIESFLSTLAAAVLVWEVF